MWLCKANEKTFLSLEGAVHSSHYLVTGRETQAVELFRETYKIFDFFRTCGMQLVGNLNEEQVKDQINLYLGDRFRQR